jgi:hypothetical protein
MMTIEDIAARLDTIMAGMPPTADEETGDPVPVCIRLSEELEISHEDAHNIVNAITIAAAAKGAQTAPEFVLIAFMIARKWGMIDAAEMMGGASA